MNKAITQDEINRLRAPFPLEAHSIREGNKTSTGKIQWFVYLEKTEVEIRLNEVFPGEWGSSQPVLTPLGNSVAATISITIRGITRGNTGEDSNGQEKAKGATTDAFRRAAADWGVAKYLWEMDEMIYTDGYEKGEWDKQKQRKNEAFAKFKTWYQKKFANYKPSNISPLPSETSQNAPNFDAAQIDDKTDVDPTNAAMAAKSALAGNHAPANGEKKIIGRWSFDRNALLTQLATWAKDVSYQERSHTVAAMDKEGAFSTCADLNDATQLVVARLATHQRTG